MFLLSLEARDDVTVSSPHVVSMMLVFLTSSWFFSPYPTSVRNILRPQVFCARSQCISNEAWLLATDLVVEALFSS